MANKEEKSYDLYTSYMNSWYDYVNTWNNMYAEYIRNITTMTESWFNYFQNFGQHNIKTK